MLTLSGTFSIPAEYLRSHDPKKETKAFVWPRWTQVSRAELQDLLRQLYCYPEPTLNENESLSAILLPVPKHNKPFLVEDQWLWLGWGLLRWALRKAKAALPEEFSVNCVDPALAHLLTAYPESENYEARVNALRAAVAPFKVVLIPIFASSDWTTLVLEKATEEQTEAFTWTLFDSLAEPLESCTEAQLLIGSLADPKYEQPKLRANSAEQPKGSLACGFYTLGWLEQQVRLRRGEALKLWIGDLAKIWRERLQKASEMLSKEHDKREQEVALQNAKAETLRQQAEKNLKKAQETAKA